MDRRSRCILACCVKIVFIILSLIGNPCQASPAMTTRIPMGAGNKACDSGQDLDGVDWNPKDTDVHTCLGSRRSPDVVYKRSETCEEVATRPVHVCMHSPITYTEDIPTSGWHRPAWPAYGTYTYVPAQRWLHSLEHGAIVFLYHPCADQTLIDSFKATARSCLYRHIITPHKKMPPGINFVLVAWKCKCLLSHPSVPAIVQFVKGHAFKSPEPGVYMSGAYHMGQIKNASVVSDVWDSNLCPNSLESTFENSIKKSMKRRKQYRELQQNYSYIPV